MENSMYTFIQFPSAIAKFLSRALYNACFQFCSFAKTLT